VWGDAVNVASRMESTDPLGRIQVPQNVYERLRHEFILEERGEVEVKGKGVMRTWFLVDRKPTPGLPGQEAPALEDLSGRRAESRTS
jgi:adenylate cyclase